MEAFSLLSRDCSVFDSLRPQFSSSSRLREKSKSKIIKKRKSKTWGMGN